MDYIKENIAKFLSPALGWDTDLIAVKAKGAYVKCSDGKEYLDFSSGTATANTGHNHPKVLEAVKEQLDKIVHSGCVYLYDSMADLLPKLAEICPPAIDMFFFSNSGAEAVEGCIKAAKYVTKRQGVLAFRGAFHGRTLGTISLTTSNAKYRKDYLPLLPSVYVAPYPYCFRCPFGQNSEDCGYECITNVKKMFEYEVFPNQLAAIIIEPEQGEGGYIPAPKKFLQFLRETCDENNIMLIYDEVQSGFGRTAEWFASKHYEVYPDLMSVAKGIASGFPLSAVCGKKNILEQWAKGAHGTTFGGSPVSCAAASATIDIVKNEKMLENAKNMSSLIFERLKQMKEKYNCIGDIRGLGLMIGVELVDENKNPQSELLNKIISGCRDEGLVLIGCGIYGNVLRLAPPMIINKNDVKKCMDIIDNVIGKLC